MSMLIDQIVGSGNMFEEPEKKEGKSADETTNTTGSSSTAQPAKKERPGAGFRPVANTRMPTYQRPLTLLPKYLANVEKYVPYTGALKRWDCYFVAGRKLHSFDIYVAILNCIGYLFFICML
jgi:hypothetical protein